MSTERVATIAKVLCQSGKFETGEGTCALICLSQLGDARKNCQHRNTVHEKLAQQIDAALSKAGA